MKPPARTTMTLKPNPTPLVATLAACTVLVLSLGGIVEAADDKAAASAVATVLVVLDQPPPRAR